jgi:hypothetical protein
MDTEFVTCAMRWFACIVKMIGDTAYCLACYSQESLVPLCGDRTCLPVITMRAKLASTYNVDSVDQLTIDEVEDYYKIREVVNARIHELSGAVPFPLYPSTDMIKNNHWKELADIDFNEGASFMSDPELDPKYIPGILEFFASLVRFESKKQTDHIKHPAVYYAMPEMLIDFAENLRVDSGF